MSGHNEGTYTPADGMDYAAHEQTYGLFVGLVKYTTIALVGLMCAMAFFLT